MNIFSLTQLLRPSFLSFWLFPILFLLDLILWGPVGPISNFNLRRALFLSSLLSVFVLWSHSHFRVPSSLAKPVTIILIFASLNLIWATIIPLVNSGDITLGIKEADAYAVLYLSVLCIIVMTDDKALLNLQRIVVYTAVILASVQVMLWGWLQLRPQEVIDINTFLIEIFQSDAVHIETLLNGSFRIYWLSSFWCIVAFFWVSSTELSFRAKSFAYSLLASSIFISNSRGLWIGLVLGLAVSMVVSRIEKALIKEYVFASGIVILIFAGGLFISEYSFVTRMGTLPVENIAEVGNVKVGDAEVSNAERVRQIKPLLNAWRKNPILGNGYGASSPDYIRSQTEPFSYENIPYALLMKLGVIGLTWFIGFLTLVAWSAYRQKWQATRRVASFLGAYSAFLFSVHTNPMFVNFVGISIFGCLLIQWTFIIKDHQHIPFVTKV